MSEQQKAEFPSLDPNVRYVHIESPEPPLTDDEVRARGREYYNYLATEYLKTIPVFGKIIGPILGPLLGKRSLENMIREMHREAEKDNSPRRPNGVEISTRDQNDLL